MKRKVLAVMLSAVMAIGLGACGNSGKDTSEKTKDTSTGNGEEITLRYAGWGSNSEKKATQKVIDKFEEEHPNIKVEYLHIPTDYNTKLTTMMAAGQEPDVAMVTGDTALQWATEGKLKIFWRWQRETRILILTTYCRRPSTGGTKEKPVELTQHWKYIP